MILDYMYNLDGDTAEFYQNDDGTVAVFIDGPGREETYYFRDKETAWRRLNRAGFHY